MDKFQVVITVQCLEPEYNIAYLMSESEMENNDYGKVVLYLTDRLNDHIKEIENGASEREESPNKKRVLN